MLVFFGTRGFQRDGGMIADRTPCPMCGNTEYHRVSRIRQWFTLYFIPIFPYSTKYFRHCARCGWDEEDKTLKQAFIQGYRETKHNPQPYFPANGNAALPQGQPIQRVTGSIQPAAQYPAQNACATQPAAQYPAQAAPAVANSAQNARPAPPRPGEAPRAVAPADPQSAYARALGYDPDGKTGR